MTVSENGNGSSEKGENPCQRSLNFAEHLLFHAVSANAGCNLRNPFPELVHRHQAAAFQQLQGFVQKRRRIDRLRQVLVAKQTPGGLLGGQFGNGGGVGIHHGLHAGMEAEQFPIHASADIQFDNIGAVPEGQLIGRQRVAGNVPAGSSPVGGDQHTPRLRQCLHRVLLCSYFVG